jgi:DNA-binding MarR family transcriptional regulator
VINHGNSIYRAAIDLDINHSTAKVILKKFRRNGFILRRKGEKKSNQLKSSNIVVNG